VNARYRGKVELTFSRKGGHGVMRISGLQFATASECRFTDHSMGADQPDPQHYR